MRLFPPVPAIHRELTEDMNVRQYTLRKGQWIYINILGLHRNPAFWKDPDVKCFVHTGHFRIAILF
eukprot:m.285388 g.285388  ORF g.285388 m.285388 type:complete len:66 (+) comp40684_c0_seq78:1161-1358(+)